MANSSEMMIDSRSILCRSLDLASALVLALIFGIITCGAPIHKKKKFKWHIFSFFRTSSWLFVNVAESLTTKRRERVTRHPEKSDWRSVRENVFICRPYYLSPYFVTPSLGYYYNNSNNNNNNTDGCNNTRKSIHSAMTFSLCPELVWPKRESNGRNRLASTNQVPVCHFKCRCLLVRFGGSSSFTFARMTDNKSWAGFFLKLLNNITTATAIATTKHQSLY